jgi:cytidine deaminase
MSRVSETEEKLLEAALKTMKNAYVLWGVRVGAAVQGEDGRVYEGCNVESWVSGLGLCAERCAVDHAVLHGNRRINKIAVVMDADKNREPRPCGACLQYINGFAKDSKIKILMARAEKGKIAPDTVIAKTLAELLPFPYKK